MPDLAPLTAAALAMLAEQIDPRYRDLLHRAADEMRRLEWIIARQTEALDRIAEGGRCDARELAVAINEGRVVPMRRPVGPVRLWDEGGSAA